MSDALIVSYGTATRPVLLEAARRTPLRLSDGPYDFPEPPDLFRLTGIAAQLAFLREHLQSQCGVWDRPARLFLDAYFRFIAAAVAADEREIAALADRSGNLFAPADWSFAALRPLPQVRLLENVRVDVAFWTGAALIAIELVGNATPRRQRRAELARLGAAGIVIVEVSVLELQRDGEVLLARLLPPPFSHFWRGVTLPASPFTLATLATIQRAGDGAAQSSASIT